MTVQIVKLGRERFVLLKEKDYRDLKAKAQIKAQSKREPRLTAQDKGDIAESRRRMAESGGKTLDEVRARLRL